MEKEQEQETPKGQIPDGLRWVMRYLMDANDDPRVTELSLHVKYDGGEINIHHSPNGAIDFDK